MHIDAVRDTNMTFNSHFRKLILVIFDHGFWRDINWNRRVWTLAETNSPSTLPLCHVCRHTQPSLHLHRQMKLVKNQSLVRKHQMPSFQASIPRTASAVGFQSVTDRRATFPFLVNQSNIIIINDLNELVGNKISSSFWQYDNMMPTFNFRFWSWSVPKKEQWRAGLLPILHGGDLEEHQTFLW